MVSMRTTFMSLAAAGLSLTLAQSLPLGWVTSAHAQDSQFWQDNDGATQGRRPARPRRDDAFRAPDSNVGPPGGFGQQADVTGQPWDGRSAGYQPPPSGGYAQGPAYSEPPPGYGGPPPGYSGPGPSYGAPQGYGTQGYQPPPAAGYGGGYDPRFSSPAAPPPRPNDPYATGGYAGGPPPGPAPGYGRPDDAYRPPQPQAGWQQPPPGQGGWTNPDGGPRGGQYDNGGYGQPYSPPPQDAYSNPQPGYGSGPDRWDEPRGGPRTYSQNEVVDTGHRFFGSVSQGLARAVESIFQRQGRPNGYILGEDAGGAFIAGLRYGEGVLTTKDAGTHKVYWQGPSLGYDFGGEGSKTMVLVYNLRDPSDIYERFGGIQGSAYLIGGISVQFQKHEHVTLAVIRSGVGLRLGANVGYLKYSRRPTWNPF